jgi:HPt (histidine-containing phosphotransfer) domain-containing protein
MATDPMSQPETITPQKQSNEQKLQAMLAALWDRSKHTVAERAALLQIAVDLWMKDRLDEPTRLSAVDSAHKLAGVLGTFGLPRGTELARKAEVLFGESGSAGKEEIGQLQLLLAELTRMIEIGPMGPR